MLFSFKVFGDHSVIFLLLVSSLIPLWLENKLYMISILIDLMRFVLYLRMCSLSECSACVFKKYFAVDIFCHYWVKCSINVN